MAIQPLYRPSLINAKQLDRVDMSAPGRWYDRSVGAHPLVETGGLAALLGLAGYYGGGAAGKGLVSLLSRTLPADKQQAMQEWLDDPDNTQRLRNWGGLAGAGLGLGYGLGKNMDFGAGLGGAARSMTTARYWEVNPEARNRRLTARLNKVVTRPYTGWPNRTYKFQWDRTPSDPMLPGDKVGDDMSAGDAFLHDEVPLRASVALLRRDPFLTGGQKNDVQGLISAAGGGRSAGFISGKDLMTTAVKAGVDFGIAYAFGNIAGRVLSLPPPIVTRISQAGGLAGALTETGIFSELRKRL